MKKISLMLLALVFLASLTSFVSAHAGEDDFSHHSFMGGMMTGAYGYGFMWLFGWIFMILVVVALVLLIIWLIKQIQKTQRKRR
jgi:uncharacterized membrane protein